MKIQALAASLLFLCGALAATAQTWQTTNMQVYATLTNSTGPAYAGTNYINATRYGEVGFILSFAAPSATTANNTVAFQTSYDATNWTTVPDYIWVVPANGTTTVLRITNFYLGPIPYIRPMYLSNAGSVNCTNVLLQGLWKGYRRD